MSKTPLTDAALANCGSMSEAGRTLVAHARRMEEDRAELINILRLIAGSNASKTQGEYCAGIASALLAKLEGKCK